MKLVEVDESIVSKKRVLKHKWEPIITEFLDSGMKVAEVTNVDVKKQSAYSALRVYAKRHNLPVETIMRGGHIYIIRKENVEE